jgi:ABC-type branched-subunit amino acid transport system permease subunit
MENQNMKRIVFMISGAIDALLGAVALLIYFNVIPVDLGVPRWVIGVLGGVLFFSGVAVFTYFFTRSEN